MNKIYLTEKPQHIAGVYGVNEPVFNREAVLSDPASFRDTEYIFSTWGMPAFTEEEIKACFPSLKAIFYGAGTVQKFARPFLNCGVRIFSAWAANAVPVAEYTVAQILLANKGFFKTMRYTDRKAARSEYAKFPGNYNVKVGIIGVGMIGRLVIEKLKDYAVEILVSSTSMTQEGAKTLGVTKSTTEEIFAQCQVVSNHMADNEQTKGILGGALFEKMPPYATFINTGRGAQVVEPELIRVLKARPDLTALLDVTFPEPPEEGSELYTLDNCILTPHIAGSFGNETRRMGDYMVEEYEKFKNGQPCQYEVTEKMLEKMA